MQRAFGLALLACGLFSADGARADGGRLSMGLSLGYAAPIGSTEHGDTCGMRTLVWSHSPWMGRTAFSATRRRRSRTIRRRDPDVVPNRRRLHGEPGERRLCRLGLALRRAARGHSGTGQWTSAWATSGSQRALPTRARFRRERTGARSSSPYGSRCRFALASRGRLVDRRSVGRNLHVLFAGDGRTSVFRPGTWIRGPWVDFGRRPARVHAVRPSPRHRATTVRERVGFSIAVRLQVR